MAGPTSIFTRLVSAFRLLALRSDIDDIILELLGQFSLEKIYADGDKETYQNLVITLLAQLNAIFNVQRLTLPSEGLQVGWYLGFLASWEVTLRTIEFVLQVVVEGRESLFESRLLRSKYLAELLLNALRFLILHPKVPSSQRAKDRRDRFARLHRSLERIFDSYPGPESFLLSVCKEVTDSLRMEPSGLGLPQKLRTELPNLATELYPLPDCLSSQYIQSIAPSDGFPGDWLSQFLTLRDISQFVVGASLQYSVNQEIRDVRLQSSSARTRNAVLRTLENIRLPSHLLRLDMIAVFSDTFRIVLPDTLSLDRASADGEGDESDVIDALDALIQRLNDRRAIHRVSDREMMHNVSQITRNIELLDDPSGHFKGFRPRLFVLNCGKTHIVGESQLVKSEKAHFPLDARDSVQISLPPKSKCLVCGEIVTAVREVTVARNVWELLKPLEPDVDTVNVERHLSTQFQLGPPKVETGMPFHASYGNLLNAGRHDSQDLDKSNSPGRAMLRSVVPQETSRPLPQAAVISPNSPGFSFLMDTDAPSEDLGSTSAKGYFDSTGTIGSAGTSNSPTKACTSSGEASLPGDGVFSLSPGPPPFSSMSNVSFDTSLYSRSKTVPTMVAPEKEKSKWRSKLTGSKREVPSRADSSSISSGTLESAKVEEIQLNNLISPAKSSSRMKGSRNVNVALSQNSTYALFWTQACINVWDLNKSVPVLGRAIATESICVLAAVTKLHLAYIIGTRDQKLTLRIVNLISATAPPIEYRMQSSPWCHSIAICPRENYVVVGFDNAIVRFYSTARFEEPREDPLHLRSSHRDCRSCPPVNTLSFSNDGLNLLASTRSMKNGIIQLYCWRFPFEEFTELANCRYRVPLHESEDGGVSSAIFRSGCMGEDNLICVTTWTRSGIPVLFQPSDGHRTDIRPESSGHGKLGSRIQCAAFSPTGRELAMVNDKGHLYHITNLNSSPVEVKRVAVTKELTTRSDWFAMSYMSLPDEEAIVLAWADASKAVAYVKKVPWKYNTLDTPGPMISPIPGPRYELPSLGREISRGPAELDVDAITPVKKSKEKG